MNPQSEEWKIWCRLDRFSRSRDRKETHGLTIDQIKKTLAYAQPSDRGKATAYIAGEEVIKELENKKENKWYERRLFVSVTSAVVAGIFALVGGYLAGVQKTVNNVPIQSNNRQYGNIYAQQIIFNENGTFKINGTALDQSTGAIVKFTAVSQDVALAGQPLNRQTNVTSNNQSGGITAGIVNMKKPARHFDEQFKTQLLDKLPKEKHPIILNVVSDSEAEHFAEEVKSFLRGDGWVVEKYAVIFNPPVIGQQIVPINEGKITIKIGSRE